MSSTNAATGHRRPQGVGCRRGGDSRRLEGKTDNHIFDWESGDKAATDAAPAPAEVTVALDMIYPRSHPAPMETWVGGLHGPGHRKLTAYITSQAPHAHRTVYALVAGLPEHKIQVISPDIGGGRQQGADLPRLAGRCRVDRDEAAREVDGGPQLEPRDDRLRPRYYMHAADRRHCEERSSGSRSTCSPTTVPSTPRRPPSSPPASSTSSPARTTTARRTARSRRLHQQGARRGLRLPVPHHRGRTSSSASSTDWPPSSGWTSPSSASRTCCGPSSSRTRHRPAGSTTPATIRAARGDAHRRLRRTAARAGGEGRARRVHGHRHPFFTEGVGAGLRKHMDILGLGMADGCELRLHPTGKAQLRLSADPGQGHETTFAQIVATSWGFRPRTSR